MTKKGWMTSLLLIGFGCAVGVGLSATEFFSSSHFRDQQGAENSNCDKLEEASVPGGVGMTVSFHTTACTTLGTSVVTYVYVHDAQVSAVAKDLVFSYSQSGKGDPLHATWTDARHVHLRMNDVRTIFKIEPNAGDISISYQIDGG